jgi:Bacterial SCP ortholog
VANRRTVDPRELRAAVAAVTPWLDGDAPEPGRAELATAVRLSLRALAQLAPGNSVEVRVPPFAVVQCVAGPRHTRGTPPNVVQTEAATWLRLATGRLRWADAVDAGQVSASGARAGEVAALLPIVR